MSIPLHDLKFCKICHEEFECNVGSRKEFCSRECQRQYVYRNRNSLSKDLRLDEC